MKISKRILGFILLGILLTPFFGFLIIIGSLEFVLFGIIITTVVVGFIVLILWCFGVY